MSYLFFIFAATTNSNAEEIAKILKVEEEDKFDESSINSIEQDGEYKLYLGYFKKKFGYLSVKTRFLIEIKNKTFQSEIKFNIPKNESIFLSHIEFSDYYHFYDKVLYLISSDYIIPPKCHKLDMYTAFKIYTENLDKLIQKDKNEVKFQLLNYFNDKYQKSNEKSLQFYLLLFKHCYNYNIKNYKKIFPKFDFSLKVKNANLIEKEFGEMIDNLSTQCEFEEENYDLIKLILFYYHSINKNKFHEFLENKNIIHKILSIIIQNYYFFKNIKKKDIIILIQNSDNIENISKILNLCENIEEKLNIVNELFDYIYEIFVENKESIKLAEEYNLLNSENNIKLILNKFYEINIKKQTKILLIEINFQQLIKSNNIKLQSLKEIKNVVNKLYYFFIEKNNTELKDLLNLKDNIDHKIHDLGVSLILQNKMSNKEIILFIEEDSHIKELGEKGNTNPYLSDFYRKRRWNKSLELIDHIDINSIDKSFIEQFKKIRFHSIYGQYENYPDLINKLFKRANNIKEFHKVFKLFYERKNNVINDELFPKRSRKLSLEILKSLLRKNKNNNFNINEFLSLFLDIIDIIYEFNQEINRIFNTIENYYAIDIISDLYIKLLNRDLILKEKFDFVVQHVIEFLTEKINQNENYYIDLLSNLRLNNIKIKIFAQFKVIKKEEIFDYNFSENLRLLQLLIKKRLFLNRKIPYIQNTLKILNSMANDINQEKIYYEDTNKIKELHNQDKLTERLDIIYFDKNKISKQIEEKIIEKITQFDTFINELEKAKEYFSIFYPSTHAEKIQKLNVTLQKLNKIELYQYEKIIEEFKFLDEFKEDINNLINKLKSKFFYQIFNIIKDDPQNEKMAEQEIVNQSNNTFIKVESLFKDIINIDIPFFSSLVKGLNSKDDLTQEINILKTLFKIDDGYNIETIVDNLYLLKQKEDNIFKLTNLLNLIIKLKCNQTNISKYLNTNLSHLKQDNLKMQDFIDINKNIKKLDISIIENEKYFSILNELMEKKEVLDFLINKKYDDIRLFTEFMDDLDGGIIQMNDINDLEKSVLFVEKLKKYCYLKNDDILIETFTHLIDNEFNDIFLHLNNIKGKISIIIDGYTESLNDDERSNKLIKYITTSSSFKIINENYQYYYCICEYTVRDKTHKKPFDDIILLKEKAWIRKKQNNDDTFFDTCQKFSNNVNKISNIIKLINEINNKGYPEKFDAVIVVNKEIMKFHLNDVNEDLDDTIDKLDYLLKKVEDFRQEYNLKNELIRLIYGKQISEIYRCLKNREETDNLKYLNKYLTNNKINKEKPLNEYKFVPNQNKELLNEMYDNCILYIEQLYKENTITISDIYKNSKLNINNYKGIYTYLSHIDSIESNVIKIYSHLTENFPISQTILFCNQETTKEEIFSFLNKSILNNENILFSIIKPEILEVETSSYLLDILNTLLSGNKNIKSMILFIYYDKNNSLINQIKKIENHKILNIDNSNKIKLKDKNEIQVYFSKESGMGKSSKIQKDFESYIKNNYIYIYFPIGDNITREEILIRLKELKKEKIALHIDLLETNKLDLIRDFLFTFLIIKYYSKEEHIFYYGEEIKIKIEVPNSFHNYFNKFPILEFFETYKIDNDNLEPLIVSNDITSNVQIVANYLRFKKNNLIDSRGLFFPNLHYTEESTEQYINVQEIIKGNDENDAVVLSQQECETLINEELSKFNINPTYYQKKTFIDVLANQLILFTKDFYIKVELVNFNQISGIRSEILNSIISSTQHFLQNAYENILKGQNISFNAMNEIYDEQDTIKRANEILSQRKIVSFDEIKKSFVFINEDQMSFSIITNCQKNSKEYAIYKKFINSGINSNNELIDYKNLNQAQYMDEIRKIFNIPPTYSDQVIKEEVLKSYIFTVDNFIKLILILIRIRANVPVILMGETGCGKTSLIRIIANISKLKNPEIKIEENNMKIFNIHAGITDNDIIEWIKKNDLLEVENKIKNLCPKILVFFDEINTCNSMGLISEILCKHTMKGKKLKFNAIFIAACNPYRINIAYNVKRQEIGLIKKGIHQKKTLVYTVNPLPFSLINFIFDFGNLTIEDETKYIKSILLDALKDEENLETNLELGIELIVQSQNFIRNKNDISSVSLREIRRFVILYKWFKKFIQENNELINHKEISYKKIQKYSLILSTYITYYIRIYDQEERNQFKKILNKIIDGDFVSYPNFLSKFIINEIEIEPGIAKNRALLENVFTIFVCINNLIPVFICGKPGCSKSLSVQLVFKSMKGDDSNKKIFKSCPKIYQNAYQGSLNSTSKGVKSVFNKARKIIKEKDPSKVISLVFFDEMGLAEISKNNPLKVIHSELEYDDNENKVAFIGISNWVLDASKMNRGIHLSIPEPIENDLIETAKSIVNSFNENYSELFRKLAISYFKYKEYMKKNHIEYYDFHGNRDFYHLIKTACKKMINYKNTREYINNERIALESIERNFGGLDYSISEFKKIFLEKDEISKKFDIMRNLKENLRDKSNRYLLIITKSSISQFLINTILNELKKKYVFFLGSRFEDDINTEEYSAKIIHKIQICMEKGTITVFKNLESIYPSLYDLFNQNFLVQDNKKYARIAIGSSNNKPYEVNDNFKSIIIVDENDIQKQDPPFLNRFEKHLFSFEILLEKELIKKSKEIEEVLKALIAPIEKNKKTVIDLQKQLILCGIEEIQGLIYQLNKSGKNNTDLMDEVLKIIANLLSQDIITYSTKTNFIQKYPAIYEKIKKYYNQNEHMNIFNFLKKMNNNKNIIYTFSDILEPIFKYQKDIIKNQTFGNISKKTIEEDLFIYNINSERQLENRIEKFIKDKGKKICIIKLIPIDCVHLHHIKFIIENFERNYNVRYNKCFIILIHMKRYIYGLEEDSDDYFINNQNLISLISDFTQIFIDNIHGSEISIYDLINLNNKKLLEREDLIKIKEETNNNIYDIFATIDYQIKNIYDDDLKQNYTEVISQKLLENNNLLKKVIESAIKLVEEQDDIIKDIFYKNNFEKFDIDFIAIIIKFLKEQFKDKLSKVIVNCERNGVISNFLLTNNPRIEDNMKHRFFDIYISNIDNINKNISKENLGNKFEIINDLNIPGIITIYYLLNNKFIENKLIEDFKTNERNLRGVIDPDEITEEINLYKSNKNNYYKKFYRIVEQTFKEKFGEEIKYLLEYITDDLYKIIYYKNENFNNLKVERGDNDNVIIINEPRNIMEFIKYIAESQLELDSEEGIFNDIDKKLIYIVIWFQCNLSFIQNIIKIYIILWNYIPDLLDKIKDIIKNNNVKFEITLRNPEYKKYTNYLFTILIESLIYSILYHFDFKKLRNDNYNEFLLKLNEVIVLKEQIKTPLKLYLKEFSNLNSLVEVSNALIEINKFDINEIEKYIQIINFQNESIKNEEFDSASNSLQDEYDFLVKNLGDYKTFSEIVIFVFSQKMMQIVNDEYRNKLLKIILKDNNLIINSKLILWILFTRYKLDIEYPDDDEENNEVEEEEEEKINNEDYYIKKFMSFINNKNINLKLINSQENIILDEILMYLFEIKINAFFNNSDLTIEKIVNGISIKYLNKCINILTRKIKPYLQHLAILYSISFIKSYFYLLSNEMYKRTKSDDNQINIEKINDILLLNDTTNVIYVIKLYFLKCLYSNMQNYHEFINFKWEENQLSWGKDYIVEEKDGISNLQFLFINTDIDIKILKNYNLNISKDKKILNFKDVDLEFYCKLINDDFMTFIDVSINIMLSEFITPTYSSFTYDYFCDLIKEVYQINKKSIPSVIKLFFERNTFEKLIRDKIKDFNAEKIEILLYAYKFVILCSLGNENSLYKNLFSEKFNNKINTIFIPGYEPLMTTKRNTYERAKEHFAVNPGPIPGFYMCNRCNQYYYIGGIMGDCSEPNVISYCKSCGQHIGGENHRLLGGSRRIYRNESERNSFPQSGITLAQFELEVREEEKLEKPGARQISLADFKNNYKKVRNLDGISYRILNFIFYSILYFNNIIGYINDNDIQKYFISGKNISDLFEDIWNCLKNLLDSKSINNIKIFMNSLFPKINDLILNQEITNTREKRLDFESKFNNIIINCINQYQNYFEKYKKINNDISQAKLTSLKTIITQQDFPELPENKFPFFKFFTVPTFPKKEDLNIEKDSNIKDKYPVIFSYLTHDLSDVEEIIHLNALEKELISKYSFNITREEARKLIIKDEIVSKNDNICELFKKFKEAYNKLKIYNREIGCHDLNTNHELKDTDSLAYILNDNGVEKEGMHLAAIYQHFIDFQNEFLNNILNNKLLYKNLGYFSESINNEIYIQDANKNELISLKINTSLFKSFQEIISIYSNRKIFSQNGINYSNYKNIEYNFDKIENEVGKIILSNKRKFKDEQKYITYIYEEYRNKSEVVTLFLENYPQSPLTEQMKEKIINFLLVDTKDYRDLLSSMNKLIFFLHNKSFKQDDDIYSEIISRLPNHIQLSKSCLNLFKNIINVNINQLIELYEYIELQCFEEFKDNLNNRYKDEISKDNSIKYIKVIENLEKKSELTKLILAKAVRKFICRYISGKRDDERFHKDSNIFTILTERNEIWDKKFLDSKNHDEIFQELTDNIDLTQNYILDFYNILNCDEKLKIMKNNLSRNLDIHKRKEKKKRKKKSQEDDFQQEF